MAFLCGARVGGQGEAVGGIFSRAYEPLQCSLCALPGSGELSNTAGRQPLPKPLFDPWLNSFLIMNCSLDLWPTLEAILCMCISPGKPGFIPPCPLPGCRTEVLLKTDRVGPGTEFKAEKSPGNFLFCVPQIFSLLLCPSWLLVLAESYLYDDLINIYLYCKSLYLAPINLVLSKATICTK